MEALGVNTGLALAVFIATDIDDLLLLAALFADPRLAPRAIVSGQFAGIGVLVLVSVLAALCAVTLPAGWIALLGLVPLGMGLAACWRQWRGADDDDEAELRHAEQLAERRLHSQLLGVAVVTIANGGDNLGAYIPLFASSPELILPFALVFAVMTALWCLLAYWLVQHPRAGQPLRRYGQGLLPFVLITLGLVILADARVLLR